MIEIVGVGQRSATHRRRGHPVGWIPLVRRPAWPFATMHCAWVTPPDVETYRSRPTRQVRSLSTSGPGGPRSSPGRSALIGLSDGLRSSHAPGQLTVPGLPRRIQSDLSVSSTTETPSPNPRPTAKGLLPSNGRSAAAWLSVSWLLAVVARVQDAAAAHHPPPRHAGRAESQVIVHRRPQPGATRLIAHTLRPLATVTPHSDSLMSRPASSKP